MHKKDLLRSVAESGYNIGYGAKLHFSTFDIVEKAPGWVGCISLVIGVFALIYPPLAENWVSAALVLGSVLALYINFYNADKSRYEEAGRALTRAFHKLRILYAEVSGCNDDANLAAYVARHEEILASASSVGITKQIFLANWYAHLKFSGNTRLHGSTTNCTSNSFATSCPSACGCYSG
jgi:hypothetical protein